MDELRIGNAKYRAILAVAQAATAQRDLSSVAAAVAAALEKLVPIDLIGVVARESDGLRLLGVYLRDAPRRSGESHSAYVRRIAAPTGVHEDLGRFPEVREIVEERRQTLVSDHVQTDRRFDGSPLQRIKAECGVVLPLAMGDALVATMTFARMQRAPFTPDEVSFLEDLAPSTAIAVANALAFEELQRLRSRLEDENLALQEEISTTAAGGIIGASPALREVLDRVARVAASDLTVLITGETGTGKELVARAIHKASRRAERAMVKVNCAALPEGLVASELFGHEKGAFTGAQERRRGRFELASGGTIFLDEVGELPAPVQVALLRVLQEREFERVGGSETLRTDARVVTATNRNLEEAARESKFRSDLYFRLNVFPIHMPALRERVEDIPVLAEYFSSRCARKVGKSIRGIDDSAMAALCAYAWPGNIRELQNVVDRAVILARSDTLGLADFELPGAGSERRTVRRASSDALDERRRIEDALAASRGRVYGVDGAAEALGVPPTTLEARIRRLGIDKHAFRGRSRPR